ncbi:MAG: hypothetical protein AMJ75_01115 [Phycisphaerae bacterium SM1_79]|nr:MAG: hypothetical protein AMJ75_01115 [Phycisphaerae bacterium SM1_79]
MNTVRTVFVTLGLSAAVLSGSCRSEEAPGDKPALQGNLLFEGQPIEAFTSIEPVFSFNNLDTEQRAIKARTEYNKGRFKIYELPQGNYNIFVSINANTDNPGRYPGYPGDFFKQLVRVSIPLEGSVNLDIDLEKVIHLTLPQDNGDIMDLWGELGEDMITFESPTEFAWDSLGDNVQYHYIINRMQSKPFTYLERYVQETTTSKTSVSIELPLNRENEFYLFHLYATKGQYRIGELKTHGKRGYANDLRFRIK